MNKENETEILLKKNDVKKQKTVDWIEERIDVDKNWHNKAKCKKLPNELFFPNEKTTKTTANVLPYCLECPVIRECLLSSISNRSTMLHGIRGGHSPLDRERIAREIQLRSENGEINLAPLDNWITSLKANPDGIEIISSIEI